MAVLPGQASMVMFYLRNFAPEDFNEGRYRGVKVVDARFVPATITPTMTPREAVEAYMAVIKGPIVESAAEEMEEAGALGEVLAISRDAGSI